MTVTENAAELVADCRFGVEQGCRRGAGNRTFMLIRALEGKLIIT